MVPGYPPQATQCSLAQTQVIKDLDSEEARMFHLVGGVFVAAMAGFIGSYGVIPIALTLATVYLLTPLIVSTAENTVVDPGCRLETAEKVAHLLNARFWQKTIFTAVCIGTGLGGVISGLVFSGIGWTLVTGMVTTSFGCDALLKDDRYLSDPPQAVNTADALVLFKMLENTRGSPPIAKLMLQLEGLSKSDLEGQCALVRGFLNTNPNSSIVHLVNHFPESSLFDCYSECICRIIDGDSQITRDQILSLPKRVLDCYLNVKNLSNQVIGLLSNKAAIGHHEVGRRLDSIRSSLTTYANRFKRLNISSSSYEEPIGTLYGDFVTLRGRLQQSNQQLLNS